METSAENKQQPHVLQHPQHAKHVDILAAHAYAHSQKRSICFKQPVSHSLLPPQDQHSCLLPSSETARISASLLETSGLPALHSKSLAFRSYDRGRGREAEQQQVTAGAGWLAADLGSLGLSPSGRGA